MYMDVVKAQKIGENVAMFFALKVLGRLTSLFYPIQNVVNRRPFTF